MHPFDDPAIVAGQGSLGLELLEDVPDLAKIVDAGRRRRAVRGDRARGQGRRARTCEIVGVQAAACAPYPESMRRGEPIEAASALTIADGIAIKRPGGRAARRSSRALARRHGVVGEDEIAEAMALLIERCKLVVEGAGAVGVAALLGGRVKPAARRRDGRGAVRRQHRRRPARGDRAPARDRVRAPARDAHARSPTAPAASPACWPRWPATGANIVDVSHVREGLDLHVRETASSWSLETRGHEHAKRVLSTLRAQGYAAQVLQ